MSFSLDFARFPAGAPADAAALRHARVPWDSQTFGLAFHELRLDSADAAPVERHLAALLAELDRETPNLVAVRIPVAATALAIALGAHGFYAVETMLGLHLPLGRFEPPVARVPAGLGLRQATSEDRSALAEMARGAFRADRFHLDPHLSSERADERYARWVERGLAEGDPVFVYEDQRRARRLGFFHVRELGEGVVDLSLAAMEPAARRVGVGLLMYQAVVAECQRRGHRAAVTHITVQNLDVFNLFARLGFSFRDPVLCLHRARR